MCCRERPELWGSPDTRGYARGRVVSGDLLLLGHACASVRLSSLGRFTVSCKLQSLARCATRWACADFGFASSVVLIAPDYNASRRTRRAASTYDSSRLTGRAAIAMARARAHMRGADHTAGGRLKGANAPRNGQDSRTQNHRSTNQHTAPRLWVVLLCAAGPRLRFPIPTPVQ